MYYSPLVALDYYKQMLQRRVTWTINIYKLKPEEHTLELIDNFWNENSLQVMEGK